MWEVRHGEEPVLALETRRNVQKSSGRAAIIRGVRRGKGGMYIDWKASAPRYCARSSDPLITTSSLNSPAKASRCTPSSSALQPSSQP